MYSELNYTQPIGEKFSLAFHAGYSWGDYWEASKEIIDYAVQANYTFGNFTAFAKFTGTDASNSDGTKVESDVGNNEPRALIGIMTTFPWGD
jgi:2',3'-cyclic-nucleotide 2'-phosphodiesterase (5'-nucleotidase family)